MESLPSQRIVSMSDTLYRLLLSCYPSEFRREYGLEMAQTFRTCCREALQQQGTNGVLQLWGTILYDFTTSVLVQYARAVVAQWKRLFMKTSAMNSGKELYTMVTQFQLHASQRTDIGPQRKTNEDRMITIIPEDAQILAQKGALFIVADGLGGYMNGDVASEMAVNAVRDSYYQDASTDNGTSLQAAMKQANTLVYQGNMAQSIQETEKMMGTTCVAAVLSGDTAYVANVGDSRTYIIRNGQVLQISLDHTPQAEQLRAGTITEEQAQAMSDNMITRCIGIENDVEVDLFKEPVQEGDILVLCTDGLNKAISDNEIRTIVEQYTPEESVDKLVELANQQSGADNVTAIVVRVSH
ncbi:MAG: protein phosphatase 2C domain-containing protein [Ktedonobacteraceae bacterium]